MSAAQSQASIHPSWYSSNQTANQTANLAVHTVPLPSKQVKHNPDGKSLLRAEDQVPSKLEGPVAAAHDSCNLSQQQDEGTLCSSTCELANEVLTTPKPAISPTASCAKWEIWELATSQIEEHHANNLNSCCFFDPRGHRSHLLTRCGRQSCTLRKPLYQASDLNWPVIWLSEERVFLT